MVRRQARKARWRYYSFSDSTAHIFLFNPGNLGAIGETTGLQWVSEVCPVILLVLIGFLQPGPQVGEALAQIFTLLLLLFPQATRKSRRWCAMTLNFSRYIVQRRKPRSTKQMTSWLLHYGNTSCSLAESVNSLLYKVTIASR